MQGNAVFHARTIARQPGFDEAAERIFGDVKRADEALEGVEFALAREPTSHGSPIVKSENGSAHDVWAIKTREALHWPSVVVYYTVDKTHVYLEDIIEAKVELDI